MTLSTELAIIGTTLVYGLRHGIDWDHIAAITDITGSSEESAHRFRNGLMYILGHAAVIIFLGALALLIGITLPSWVDAFMEPVVGITLLGLGIWLIISILVQKEEYKLKSRWMVLFVGVRRIHRWLDTSSHHKTHEEGEVGTKTAFAIGSIHGVGAETPTQLLLFLTVAGVAGKTFGLILIGTFVAGLIISNTLISLFAITGFSRLSKNKYAYISFGLVSAMLSIIIGSMFLLGYGAVLPAIISG